MSKPTSAGVDVHARSVIAAPWSGVGNTVLLHGGDRRFRRSYPASELCRSHHMLAASRISVVCRARHI